MWFARITSLLLVTGWILPAGAALREPVHPRRNVEEFAPIEAKFVRFTVRATNRGEPCLDELEIYAADEESRNVALAVNGARATASGSLPGYAIHQLEGVNDGRYGNGRSWIAERVEGAWVQIELPQATRIQKVIWGRDREGNFMDRLATLYQVEIALETNAWRTVASSDDREPLAAGAELSGILSVTRQFVNRVAPAGTTLSPDAMRVPSEYAIDVWQTSDGLPGNTVTAVRQTPDGYLWVATLNGLARFDGLNFKVFREADGLPNNRVLCLLVDAKGTLWTGTEGGGLASFRDGKFRTLNTRDGLSSDTVTALAEDRDGTLWIGTRDGLAGWRDGAFLPSPPKVASRRFGISKLLFDHAGTLWALIEGAVFVQRGDELVWAKHGDEPSSFSTMFAAHQGSSGHFWFGGANGYIAAMSGPSIRVFPEQPGQLLGTVWELIETRSGEVWAGTANGGLRRLRSGNFYSLTTQEGLSDNSVLSLFEDREGNLWVGTVGGGLNRVKPRKLTTATTRDGLSHNVVMALAEDTEGTLWIGSNGGGLSTRRDGRFKPHYANYLIDNESVWSLQPARNGALWAGTLNGGLFRMRDRQVEDFSRALGGEDDAVLALVDDGDEGLWVGMLRGGLKHFQAGRVVGNLQTNGLPAVAVTSLLRNTDGSLWIGTGGKGVFKHDGRGVTDHSRLHGLPSDIVRTLHQDTRGVLWIGTGGGLARLADGKLTAFTRAHGLPDEVISQILEDDRGNFWFGCNQGLFRVAGRELEAVASGKSSRVNAISYGRAEGMESLECTGGFHPAGLKTRDGKLWFSTVKGLVMVEPATISFNETPPPVVIEEAVIDGQSVPLSALPAKGLKLEPGVQRVEIRFTALSLVAAERNLFKYRLDGLEKSWVEAGPQRVAAYSHLPPGNYEFRVIASNNDGVWNESGAALRLSVLPHYWQTWWFRALTIVVLLGGVGWVVRAASVQRLRWTLRRLEEQHAVEKERTRIAQDIHDELGANLTRIALLTEVGQKHRNDPDEVSADLGRISVTAREAVRAMDAIVWAVNPRNDSLDHFANYISQFAEEFFRPTPVRCRLDIPADLPEHPISTEARHHLLLAVKEALNNVVRHSGASEVWLRLTMERDELKITVADNGHGITAAHPAGDGHDGLRNIRDRIEALGGRFEMNSNAQSGTTLCLRLSLPGSMKLPAA